MVLHKEFMKINFLQRIITARSLQKRIYVPSTGISGHPQALVTAQFGKKET